MKGKRMALALAVLMLIGMAHSATGQIAMQLKDVQVEQQTDSVTVKLRTTGTPIFSASLIDTPTRLVIDLADTSYAWDKSRVNPDVAPIREIRGSQWKVGTARIVLELTRKVGYRIEPSAEGLSVVLEPAATAASEDTPKATASKPASKAAAKPEVAKAETPKPDVDNSETVKIEPPRGRRRARTLPGLTHSRPPRRQGGSRPRRRHQRSKRLRPATKGRARQGGAIKVEAVKLGHDGREPQGRGPQDKCPRSRPHGRSRSPRPIPQRPKRASSPLPW